MSTLSVSPSPTLWVRNPSLDSSARLNPRHHRNVSSFPGLDPSRPFTILRRHRFLVHPVAPVSRQECLLLCPRVSPLSRGALQNYPFCVGGPKDPGRRPVIPLCPRDPLHWVVPTSPLRRRLRRGATSAPPYASGPGPTHLRPRRVTRLFVDDPEGIMGSLDCQDQQSDSSTDVLIRLYLTLSPRPQRTPRSAPSTEHACRMT